MPYMPQGNYVPPGALQKPPTVLKPITPPQGQVAPQGPVTAAATPEGLQQSQAAQVAQPIMPPAPPGMVMNPMARQKLAFGPHCSSVGEGKHKYKLSPGVKYGDDVDLSDVSRTTRIDSKLIPGKRVTDYGRTKQAFSFIGGDQPMPEWLASVKNKLLPVANRVSNAGSSITNAVSAVRRNPYVRKAWALQAPVGRTVNKLFDDIWDISDSAKNIAMGGAASYAGLPNDLAPTGLKTLFNKATSRPIVLGGKSVTGAGSPADELWKRYATTADTLIGNRRLNIPATPYGVEISGGDMANVLNQGSTFATDMVLGTKGLGAANKAMKGVKGLRGLLGRTATHPSVAWTYPAMVGGGDQYGDFLSAVDQVKALGQKQEALRNVGTSLAGAGQSLKNTLNVVPGAQHFGSVADAAARSAIPGYGSLKDTVGSHTGNALDAGLMSMANNMKQFNPGQKAMSNIGTSLNNIGTSLSGAGQSLKSMLNIVPGGQHLGAAADSAARVAIPGYSNLKDNIGSYARAADDGIRATIPNIYPPRPMISPKPQGTAQNMLGVVPGGGLLNGMWNVGRAAMTNPTLGRMTGGPAGVANAVTGLPAQFDAAAKKVKRVSDNAPLISTVAKYTGQGPLGAMQDLDNGNYGSIISKWWSTLSPETKMALLVGGGGLLASTLGGATGMLPAGLATGGALLSGGLLAPAAYAAYKQKPMLGENSIMNDFFPTKAPAPSLSNPKPIT